jgi:hypothetical protein
MRRRRLSIISGVLSLLLLLQAGSPLSQRNRRIARDEVLDMLHHALDSYMKHAYPWDELKPLSCEGRRWDQRERGTLDDSLGGYGLTLVDSMSTLAIVQDGPRLADAVRRVVDDVSFDRDVDISVFEATIRVLGGLLSTHELLLTFPDLLSGSAFIYGGELLILAKDLGDRLLPAFETPTGIPSHRVNLRRGMIKSETRQTCVAAAGTLLLEMAWLTRLTGVDTYELKARRAVDAVWRRRSSKGLVGNTIDIDNGHWHETHSGIGAGIDSFYEYLLKSFILTGDQALLADFEAAYEAAQKHTTWGEWNIEVSMQAGQPYSYRVSALQAFWPSLQVLHGDLSGAKATHLAFYKLWKRYRALPEIYDVKSNRLLHFARDSPLRPEFAESTFHLYTATGSEFYLDVAFELVHALQNISRVDCGFAAIADVRTHRLDDRMDSYFIAETLKYLFLTFDRSLEVEDQVSLFCPVVPPGRPSFNASYMAPHRPCLPAVRALWTTEGHLVILDGGPLDLQLNGTEVPPTLTTGAENSTAAGQCASIR